MFSLESYRKTWDNAMWNYPADLQTKREWVSYHIEDESDDQNVF